MDNVVFFRVEATGVGDLVDQLGLLRREAKQLQKDMNAATDPAMYTKLNRELENNKNQQKAIAAELKNVENAQKNAANAAAKAAAEEAKKATQAAKDAEKLAQLREKEAAQAERASEKLTQQREKEAAQAEKLAQKQWGEYERAAAKTAAAEAKLAAQRQKEATQEAERQAKIAAATNVPVGSYRALNMELVKLRQEYKLLTSDERASEFGQKTVMQIQRLDQELRQVDASMGQFQRNVGNYPGGNRGIAGFSNLIQQAGGPLGNFVGQLEGMQAPLMDVAGSFGMTGTAGLAAAGGIAAAGIVIAKGVSNAMEFETAFAQLSATLGVSGAEADALKERISELETITLSGGAQIVSTSTQIADALTVVGSAAPQLLKNQEALQAVTKEVIVFSKSAGTDLAGAAKVVTGAINLFGLEASEAARVVNVLAAGEKEGSATTLEAADALEKAGGAARLSGVSIEQTTAAIQLLAKDSLKGSEAGTQLRNVLLKLSTAEALPPDARKAFEQTGQSLEFFADKAVPLEEKLKALKTISGDTAAMTKIFGTENINAAISLTKYADEFPNLTAAITNTTVAYDQAGVKQDTFAAKLENIGNKLNNVLTTIGEAFLPILSALADILTGVFSAIEEVNTAVGDVAAEIFGATEATGMFSKAMEFVGSILTKIISFQFKAFVMAIRGIGATFAGIKAIIGDIPTAISQLVENSIDHLTIFALKAKAAFANASNFITFGLAGGGEEFVAQADAIYNNMQERVKGNVDILGKFSAAFNGFLDEAKQKEVARKQAADQAVAAEEEAIKLAEKLKADAEAEAARKKKAEEAAKKAAEEAAKRAEEERRNLNFLRAELAKVEEQLKKYTDKSLIPTALLQSYNSLKGEIASVEKQLDELFKIEQKPTIPVFVELQGQTDFVKQFNDLNKQLQAEAQKAASEGISEALLKRQQEQYAADVEEFKNAEDMKGQIREKLIKAAFDISQQASDAIFKLEEENAQRRLDKQMDQLEQAENEQLALVEGNAIAEQQVREEFAAQREQLEREAFERKKQMDIAQAIMNSALAITQVFATTPFPLNLVMAAIVGAQTAVQVATIAAQQFADGGLIKPAEGATPKAESGIFVGPSHARGGINTRLSGRLVNVEGGEYYERLADGSSVVINKRSTGRFASALRAQAGKNYAGKLQALSAINEMGGGVPLYATGGLIAPMGNPSADRQSTAQTELLAMALSRMEARVPVLTLQSFDTVNARANQVKTLQGL